MRDLVKCSVSINLKKSLDLHSPISCVVQIVIEDEPVYQQVIDLPWQDMYLLDVAAFGLVLANASALADRELLLIDELHWRNDEVMPLCLATGFPGVGATIWSAVKRVGGKDVRSWFISWSFSQSPWAHSPGIGHNTSLVMVVDPTACERFGRSLQKQAIKLDTKNFQNWAPS